MMMRLLKLLRIVVVMICFLAFLTITKASAQNFADLNVSEQQASEQEEAQELTEDNIRTLMESAKSVNPAGQSSKYTLGPKDVIEIKVMRHPEVSGRYPISQEGTIQYEFVGDVKIMGHTKNGVVDIVKKQLSEYIVNPEVSVKILEFNSKIVYVVGEVFRPGKIFMQGDTITVREALMLAGLPQLSGITKKSHLITPAEDGKAVKKHVNVYALLYQGDLRENFTMRPGDVLYIPPTFLTKTMRAIQPITAPIGEAAGTAGTAYGY